MWNPFRMSKEDIKEQQENQNSDQTAEQEAAAENAEDVSVVSETENVSEKEEKLTPEEIKTLREKAAQAEENWNKLLHLVADFDNFKKRAERKRQDDILSAKIAVIETFLPVLDNFEMAFMAASQVTDPAAKSLKQGIEMVLSQFHNVLRDCGVDTIDPCGQPFDHSYHEAINEVESDSVPEGAVVTVLRKGYKLGDRLIRAARVSVARKAVSSKEEQAE